MSAFLGSSANFARSVRMRRGREGVSDIGAESEKTMDIREFGAILCRQMRRHLGEAYLVEERLVRKNNGVRLHGLTVSVKGCNLGPTVYVEDGWRMYLEGADIGQVEEIFLNACREVLPAEGMDAGFLTDFEKAKERVCFRLVGREKNKELLKEVPHTAFLDMAVYFYYAFSHRGLGPGAVAVDNGRMEKWGTNAKELMGLAMENTPRIYPWKCEPMTGILERTAREAGWVGPKNENFPLKVLSNRIQVDGASCLLYPGVLDRMGKKLGNDFFVLPSSVHEVILLEDNGKKTPEELKKIILEANRTVLAPEEILTDTLYRYCRRKKRLEMIL